MGGREVRVFSSDSKASVAYSVAGLEHILLLVEDAVGVASSNTSSGTDSEGVWSRASLIESF